MSARSALSRRVAVVVVSLIVVVAGLGLLLGLLLPRPPVDGQGEDFPDLLVHVHGLGVDPGDGALYAATHTGLFRLPDDASGRAVRVADRWQDTMAFTVVGPHEFLASGHPDLREDKPDVLGLIRSRDAGQTWESLSLAGRSDFHALETAGGTIFGYDSVSQRLLVTQDAVNWQPRAAVALSALVADPADVEVLLVATDEGELQRSGDGGETFTPVPAAPQMGLLTWAPAGPVYGVAADGTVLVSVDEGMTWLARGTLDGPAQAITAETSTVLYAATRTGIYRSTDGGQTFQIRYHADLRG